MDYLKHVSKKLGLEEDPEIGLPIHIATTLPVTLWYDHEEDNLILLDQNRLPFEVRSRKISDWKEGVEAIKSMVVRGSQAIGVAGAYTLLIGALQIKHKPNPVEDISSVAKEIAYARPTAAPLAWATLLAYEYSKKIYEETRSIESFIEALRKICDFILAQDMALNYYMRKYGQKVIKNGDVIMTHCNGGSLSSTLMGHALGVIEEAYSNGVDVKVVSKETRPRSQGYRLTVWELNRVGVPTTIITDNMISISFERLGVNKAMLGADRVARDGSVANKIGSVDIARIFKYFKAPFYYATSYSTISLDVKKGNEIEIEERSIDEVTYPYSLIAKDMKEKGLISSNALDEWPPSDKIVTREPGRGEVRIFNPAFDVTPPKFITAIITDIGILRPNQIRKLTEKKILNMVKRKIIDFGLEFPEGLSGITPQSLGEKTLKNKFQ
ncbi:MAG: s-methyl-5-thioribose-1-phosphate isomerase [Nitrososphaerota archaeon]|nr:s-methyl-5-thioribose-1-phosphate isomerase [Nitrososphaerota archaeon]